MKWLPLAFVLLGPPMPPSPGLPVTFRFKYPTNQLSQVHFIAYSTSALTQPSSQWHVLTNIAGSNVIVTTDKRNARFSVLAPVMDRFFILSASNNVGVVFNK